MRHRSRAIAAVVTLLAAPAVEAARKPHPLSTAPAWLQEATARRVEGGPGDFESLHDELVVEPLAGGGVRVTRRVAMRALSLAGLRGMGSAGVTYRRGDRVESLRAWGVLPDGTFREADPPSATDAPYIPEGSVFEDIRVRLLESPALAVRGVFAYEWVLWQALDPGAWSFLFGEADRPAAHGRLSLRLPPGFGYSVERRNLGEAFVEESDARGIAVSARDLPPLPREPMRPPAPELMPRVWVRWWSEAGDRGFADWDAVSAWYEKLSRPVLAEKGEAAALGASLRPASPAETLGAIAEAHRFAAREVRYVSIQIGIGGYRPSTPAVVCASRYGDCKDKTFLMRALLDGWGLETFPVLVRTSDLGPIEGAVPTPLQFNHCILGVLLPVGLAPDLWPVAAVDGIGRVMFLDPTARDGSPWTLPEADQGTTALLVHRRGGELVRLPVQPAAEASVLRRLRSRIDDQGRLLEATLEEAWSGTIASRVRGHYRGMDEEERRADVLEDVQGRFPGATVAEHRIEGLDEPLAPVVETTRLAGGRAGKRVGDLLILEPGSATYGLLHREPLPAPPRRWPLDLGLPRQEVAEIAIDVPAGWVPEELPGGIEVSSPFLEARSAWILEAGKLVYRRSAALLRAQVPPDDYPAFREQVLRVEAEDARAVVFVRGS
jgi:hypothetical protein